LDIEVHGKQMRGALTIDDLPFARELVIPAATV